MKNKAEKKGIECSGEGGNFSFIYGKVREELTEKKRASQQRREAAGGKRVSHPDIREKTIPDQGKCKSPGAGGVCPEEQRGGQ